ncbi:glycine C-acetyltransferase/8-amino-7-oxononanoate synthase [Orenia metallireducens]|uniref:8-amino-7-ketopelargonate synthase n=1 Tax=Orenia metallireducens TaxID=1413210 RepID=A0A285G0F0_9FIRM|nr:8-amino-7-oxononanoate synthase [Orenia metallireducens]PRX35579.1 glycine C-acetyltransferase/8-amino-7-oxononanoate synthase [Orenia metallireducens]SNY15941.1 glycine C-acetyltransferase/8-amino-7-oxononanoate synthase [Orenia metallireducens]
MNFWNQELSLLKAEGLHRELKRLESSQSPRVIIDNREVIMLASNNYLGLSTEQEIKEAVIRVIQKYGTGSGGSRLTTGNYDLHEQLEKELADFKNTEDALVFNTGYMANLGVLATVVGSEDVIISDKLNHASIIDGCRLSKAKFLVYKHGNLARLENILKRSSKYRRRLIVTDGVFSMDGDLAPLPEIVELAEKYQALVMVDDAHGTGVLGSKGAGTIEHFGLEGKIDIQIGTLSKALAAEGGFVAGSKDLIELLRNKARSFIYSTALAPATIAASLASLRYLQSHPELFKNLWRNVNLLKDGLEDLGYELLPSNSAIIPIMIGDREKTMELSKALLVEGVLASGIRPPTVAEGTSRIRVTVMASHSVTDIEEVLDIFARVGRELKLIR